MIESSKLRDSLINKDAQNSTSTSSPTERVPTHKSHRDKFLYKFPFSQQTYFMVIPIENVHIYLWILKDLSWAQDWVYPARIFGTLAVIYCTLLFYEAFVLRSYYEAYMAVGTTLWLAANYVWMEGEVVNTDDNNVVTPSAILMEVAIVWILLYYLLLKPLKILKIEQKHTDHYNSIGLRCRFTYFENWREYEHLHTLLWLCKDLSWNQNSAVPWVVFMVPTFLIAVDFIHMTWATQHMFIDCSHYIAQMLWVAGNATWALGQLFSVPGNDDRGPYSLWNPSYRASTKLRWWSSVVLFAAFMPIAVLYVVWLPLTAHNYIKAADIPENKHITRFPFIYPIPSQIALALVALSFSMMIVSIIYSPEVVNLPITLDGDGVLKLIAIVSVAYLYIGLFPPTQWLSSRLRAVSAPSLAPYIQTGNSLRAQGLARDADAAIEHLIQAVVQRRSCGLPSPFGYILASAGFGKTQTAFALKSKVLYIPLELSQDVHHAFSSMTMAVEWALMKDAAMLSKARQLSKYEEIVDSYSASQLLMHHAQSVRFYSLGVVVGLLEAFRNQSRDQSSNVFLGCDTTLCVPPLTITEAMDRVTAFREAKYCVFLDEIPAKEDSQFTNYLLIRNLLRVIGMPTVLCGTETVLLPMFDYSYGSRCETNTPWVVMLTSLPRVDWTRWAGSVQEQLQPFEHWLLSMSRPLFIDWFFSCANKLQQQQTKLGTLPSVSVLSPELLTAMKLQCIDAKKSMLGREGLQCQLSLIFLMSFPQGPLVNNLPRTGQYSSPELQPSESIEGSAQERVIRWKPSGLIQHHCASLIAPSTCDNNDPTSVATLYNRNGSLTDGKGNTSLEMIARSTFDPADLLMIMTCLRGGLCMDLQHASFDKESGIAQERQRQARFPAGPQCITPSTFAFSTFRLYTGYGNYNTATGSAGCGLETEALAACVLASHRYDTFKGTTVRRWLALVIAELSALPSCEPGNIVHHPVELESMLDEMIGIASPPNMQWGDELPPSFNLAQCIWTAHQDEVNIRLQSSHGLHIRVELKDCMLKGRETTIQSVIQKVAEDTGNHLTLLIAHRLQDQKSHTGSSLCHPDVNVYVMETAHTITPLLQPHTGRRGRVSRVTQLEGKGKKTLIVLDLKALHPQRPDTAIYAIQ